MSVVRTNVRGRDIGSFVAEAKRRLQSELKLPPGRYFYEFGGQFEHLQRARTRLMVVVPVAVVGGLVGGVAGAAVQAATSDPLGRTASARGTIEQAIADMRLTNGLASRTSEQLKLPLAKAGNIQDGTILEVGVSELEILAHETEMALVLRARSRLYRSGDGKVLEEHEAETQTEFKKYRDWAADGGQPLRDAVDYALVRLGRSLVSARRESQLRAGTLARLDG